MNPGDTSKMNYNNTGPPQFKRVWNNNPGKFLVPNTPAGGHMNLNPSSSSLAQPGFKGLLPSRGVGGATFLAPRSNWKKKQLRNNNNNNKGEKRKRNAGDCAAVIVPGVSQVRNYEPPRLHELQKQNRLKARRFYSKKKFNRFAPFAPRNTTSYIIRAKRSGGIASLVSPCPVTPAILPTPIISPTREGLMDMAKQEWGLDGYGSMKGFIRLREDGHGHERFELDNRVETDESSSESDVEEHAEMERRVDHDLSRFVMTYPSTSLPSMDGGRLLETRVDDQENHIARLEEENLTLKERLFLMEQEMNDLRRRLMNLETGNPNSVAVDNNHSNVIDNIGTDDDAAEICSEKSVDGGDGEAEAEGLANAQPESECNGNGNGELEGHAQPEAQGDRGLGRE